MVVEVIRFFTDFEFRAEIARRHPIAGRLVLFTVIQAPWFALVALTGASPLQRWLFIGLCIALDIFGIAYYLKVERPGERRTESTEHDETWRRGNGQ